MAEEADAVHSENFEMPNEAGRVPQRLPIHADSCRSALTYALPLCNTETHATCCASAWSLGC